eukprot:166134-Rhodomonas_salina.2
MSIGIPRRRNRFKDKERKDRSEAVNRDFGVEDALVEIESHVTNRPLLDVLWVEMIRQVVLPAEIFGDRSAFPAQQAYIVLVNVKFADASVSAQCPELAIPTIE